MEEGSTPWKRAPLHSMEEGSTPLYGGGLYSTPWRRALLHSMEEGSTPLHGGGLYSTPWRRAPLNSMERLHSTPWTKDSTPWRWPQLYSIEGDSNPLHEMGLHYTPWRGTPLHSTPWSTKGERVTRISQHKYSSWIELPDSREIIQKGLVAKSYMTNGILMCMVKYLRISSYTVCIRKPLPHT
jgi:hypothetical protein